MNKSLDEMQAQLTALVETLDLLEKDHEDGTLDDAFFFKRRVSLVRGRELTLNTLKDILNEHNAEEMSNVLDSVAGGAKDEEIDKELSMAQEAGDNKGWGEVLKEEISEKKGSIVQMTLSAAMKVARFLLSG